MRISYVSSAVFYSNLINLSTVTYLCEGAIDHRDSLGTYATIRPGACNLMTAGRGIVHSERTPQAERATGSAISGMQTWLALPDGKEEVDPAFEHVPAGDLPLVEDGSVSARVVKIGRASCRERVCQYV